MLVFKRNKTFIGIRFPKMWMAYRETKPAVDLRTAVVNLEQQYSDLQWDAEHEAVYGMGRFYSEEECTNLAKKYEKIVNTCSTYLNNSNLETFLQIMKEMGYEHILDEVFKFITAEMYLKVFKK